MEYALAQDDFVGISFWLATAIMLASTVFFLAERDNVRGKWKTSLTVAALVTGVATPVTKAATVNEVFHLPLTLSLSARKKTVEASMIAVASQKEIPTKSSCASAYSI